MKMIDVNSFISTLEKTETGYSKELEETDAWLKPLIGRVPITRISNVAPLDILGLPCWSAVTPLAKDLTTHAGKGLSALAARISAIMEAIERVSAEQVPESSEGCLASYADLRQSASIAVVDPTDCGLPFRTAYSEKRKYSWIKGFDLIQSEPIWTPIDLAISPALEGMRFGPNTNGLASGNCITEAVLHAACEIIERDAIAQNEFWSAFAEESDDLPDCPRPIDPTTLPADVFELVRRITHPSTGLSVVIYQLVSETQMPVYASMIIDPNYPTSDGLVEINCGGWGCSIDARRAVVRSITEAAQCRAITIQGARDSSEGGQVITRRWSLCCQLALRRPKRHTTFDVGGVHRSGDLLVDLTTVCSLLASAGFPRLIVVDLTRGDLQVPVVRVIIPGMATPQRYGLRPSWRQLEKLL